MSDTRVRTGGLLLAGIAAAALSGCAGEDPNERQSALNPIGRSAQAIDVHWWTMFWMGTAVWVIVVVIMLATLVRRRRRPSDDDGQGRRPMLFVAVAGAIIPAVILVAVLIQGVWALDRTQPAGNTEADTSIAVTAHQYWWEVEYPDDGVVTANEIHIPTGQSVEVELTASDVVHSVWVPELSGKADMIPGRSNSLWLETDQPGTYWGQCAEYCGAQHALMRFVVVAHEPEEYESWLQAQAEPAVSPDAGTVDGPPEIDTAVTPAEQDEDLVARGRDIFMSSSCVYCHTISGTEAQGRAGPDLTHLGSRQNLAAGTLPNNPGNLAAWVIDPQAIKPGNQMPGTDIEGDELQALLAYLENLE